MSSKARQRRMFPQEPRRGDEPLFELVAHVDEDRVAHVEYGLGAPVVLLELDHPAPGEAFGEFEDVAVVRPPESVYALSVVAHGHDVAATLREERHDVRLNPVRVLELVDHEVPVPRRDPFAHLLVVEGGFQVDEEVVVVETVVPPLVLAILLLDGPDLLVPLIVVATCPRGRRRGSSPC